MGCGSAVSRRIARGATMNSVRRFLTTLALALWWGGFTFYALVVIPTAQKVLHSHVKVGFITQQVTGWLNWCGVAALVFLLWHLLTEQGWSPRARRVFWISWLVMLAAQISLFILHPRLDALLDFSAREILDEPRFYFLHRVYLCVSTGQWLAGVVLFRSLFRAP